MKSSPCPVMPPGVRGTRELWCRLRYSIPGQSAAIWSFLNEDEAERTIKKQMSKLVQLNKGHSYTYARSSLAQMLDEALDELHPQ